jgi:hypothetical protein
MLDVALKVSQAAIFIFPRKSNPQLGMLAAVIVRNDPAAALLKLTAEVAVKFVQASTSMTPTSLRVQSLVPVSPGNGPPATRLSEVFLVALVVMMLVEADKVSQPLNDTGGGGVGIGGISSTSVKLNVQEG